MIADALLRYRLRRGLHPFAWWAFAVAMAAAASRTTNPLALALLLAITTVVVLARRGDGPWASSFRLYLVLGAFVVAMRVVYRVVFGGGDGDTVVLRLPEIALPYWVGGIRLLGAVSTESLLSGFYDGLRLATIIVCVGAANALANPRRLLANLPGALYEIGTVLVISVGVFSQLAESVLRVRRAQALRGAGAPGSGVRSRHRWVRAVVVPVLEDAIERSVRLAASMDARGYGRTGALTVGQRAASTTLTLLGIVGLAVGAYLSLSDFIPPLGGTAIPAGVPVLALGGAAAVGGLALAGRRVRRTRHRPEGWGVAETIVVVCGLAPWWVFARIEDGPAAGLLVPPVTVWPEVTLPLLLGVAVAALPAVLTPPPALGAAGPVPTAAVAREVDEASGAATRRVRLS